MNRQMDNLNTIYKYCLPDTNIFKYCYTIRERKLERVITWEQLVFPSGSGGAAVDTGAEGDNSIKILMDLVRGRNFFGVGPDVARSDFTIAYVSWRYFRLMRNWI